MNEMSEEPQPLKDACKTIGKLTCCKNYTAVPTPVDCPGCPGIGLCMSQADAEKLAAAWAVLNEAATTHQFDAYDMIQEVCGYSTRRPAVQVPFHSFEMVRIPVEDARTLIGGGLVDRSTVKVEPPTISPDMAERLAKVIRSGPDPKVRELMDEVTQKLWEKQRERDEAKARRDLSDLVNACPEPVRRLIMWLETSHGDYANVIQMTAMAQDIIDQQALVNAKLNDDLRKSRNDAKKARQLLAKVVETLRLPAIATCLLHDRKKAYDRVDTLVSEISNRLEMAARIQGEAQARKEETQKDRICCVCKKPQGVHGLDSESMCDLCREAEAL